MFKVQSLSGLIYKYSGPRAEKPQTDQQIAKQGYENKGSIHKPCGNDFMPEWETDDEETDD